MTATPPNVGLCGFMGTGKSHLGHLLAERLSRPLVDTDALLEAQFGTTVAAIFGREGEDAFRSAEGQLCRRLAAESGRVVALGGGALLDPATRDAWLQHGTLICLRATPATLLERTAGAGDRPLLNCAPGDRGRRLAELLAAREPAYAAVPHQVATDANEDVALTALMTIVAGEEQLWRACGDGVERRVVQSPAGPYPIWLGRDCLGAVPTLLGVVGISPGPVVVVSHTELRPHWEPVCDSLRRAGYTVELCCIESGERAKTQSSVDRIHTSCLAARLARDRPLVAVGGGVVGDVAGFAAATFMRGVPFIQVPTTLLAMVDSSIGGKTGIDRPEGKNLVGAFHHPRAVLVDVATLATLPAEELRSGMGEVVKHALLAGGDLLAELESGRFTLDPSHIARVVDVKATIVAEDPAERGRRAVLNLGHTFAHAIEQVSGYRWRHGDAVAVGLVAAAHLGVGLGVSSPALPRRIEMLLTQLGLHTRVRDLDADQLIAAMALDKKRSDGELRFVVLRDVGEPSILSPVTDDALRAAWAAVTTPST